MDHIDHIRKKMENFMFYYGLAVLAVCLAAAAAVFLIRDIRRQRATDVFYIMAPGLELDEDVKEALQKGLARALMPDQSTQQCKIKIKIEIKIETAYSGHTNMQSEATIAAYMQSGRVDLLLAPEEVFNRYASTGYLSELGSGAFDGLLNGRGAQELFFASQADYSQGGAAAELPFHPHEETDGSGVYGIYCQEGLLDGFVAGIMVNCPNKTYVKKGLQYVLSAAFAKAGGTEQRIGISGMHRALIE